jgi:REP element-mobilizing transposase RayT
MSDENWNLAIAYHIVWTTYGTWLPGDARGWVKKGHAGVKSPDRKLQQQSRLRMKEAAIILTDPERLVAKDTIAAHCAIRRWSLHAANARTTHVHVVTADRHPDEVMNQLKARCSQRLSDEAGLKNTVAKKAGRRRWFTEGGGKELIYDEEYLRNAIRYVLEGQ